jgi:hypothetical protein
MTPQERKAEFGRLFSAIPGRNIDRIRKVCAILHYKENTVRIFTMKGDQGKTMPEAKLKILQRELQREGIAV